MGFDKMDRLIYIVCGCFFIVLLSSCTLQKEFVPLDRGKLEAVNNAAGGECLNGFDNNILITVLQENNIDYIIENDEIYVEKRLIEKRGFFDNISHDIEDEIMSHSIPDGYVLFKYKKMNYRTDEYETRPLDDLDKKLLPIVTERNSFKSIVINDCVYVERGLMDDQDLLHKALYMLDYERGDGPNPYSFPYPHPLISLQK